MLQKIKMFASKYSLAALEVIKRNIPAAVSLVLTVTAIVLTVVCSAHTVTVFDGRRIYTASGLSSNLDSTLKNISLESGDYEIVNVSNHLFSTKVEIDYLVPLTVKIGDKVTTYTVCEGDLMSILKGLNIKIDENDTLSIPKYSYIDKATTVEITDVEYVTETKTEAIPYGTDVVYSSDYDTNTSFVTSGKVGTKTVTYCVKYVNGIAVSAKVLGENITEYAIDKTTVYGTSSPQYAGNGVTNANDVPCISTLDAPDDLLLDSNGKPVKYTSKKTLRATAYSHTGNRMATGKYPKPGYVAVDPKEIPYGTKMYIVSADGKYVYGYAIAADTGGFIKGTRTDMDLFFNTENECVKFGRRDIVVYFVD